MNIGAWGRRAARRAGLVLVIGILGCGGGGGSKHTFDLPAGSEFDTVASDRVLLVVESRNQCRDSGDCAPTPAPTPASACDVGNGNTRGLSIYRLGVNGRFLADPTNPDAPEGAVQRIPTADNPRRILVSPTDPTIVYVATNERLQVFRLGAGGSQCIAQTLTEKEADPHSDNDLDPVDFALDPTVGNGVLYVAGRGSNRVDAYSIADDGTIAATPQSCVIGSGGAEFTALSLLTRDFVAASGRDTIDVYRRVEGQFPPATPLPGATPTAAPSPGCFGAQRVTDPVSSIGAAIVTDTFFLPSGSFPIGELFVSEEVSQRLFTFNIDLGGIINGNETSSTKRDGFYQDIRLRNVGGNTLLYASVFQEGRLAVFQLENGLLPNEAFSKTEKDPKTLPVGLAIDESTSMLYVGEGGIGRIDGFRIEANGALSSLPETSVDSLRSDGRQIDAFPSDIALIPAP